MLNNSGYRRPFDPRTDDLDWHDGQELVVDSCGHYRLIHRQQMETIRPAGRPDYQLIYIAGGCARFLLTGAEQCLTEGCAVFYRPGEPQIYRYERNENPDIYWLHFTGTRAEEVMQQFGWSEQVRYVGLSSDYIALFDRIIGELQLKRTGFETLTAAYFWQLLAFISRHSA